MRLLLPHVSWFSPARLTGASQRKPALPAAICTGATTCRPVRCGQTHGRRRRPGSSTAEVDLIPPAALQPACTALQCGVLLASQPVAPAERERGREREETDADADGSGVLCESSVTGVYVRERGGYGAGAAAIGRPREERSRGEEDKAGRHTAGRQQEGTGR